MTSIRDQLIAAGLLRVPALDTERKPRPGAYVLDGAGIVRAAALIIAGTPAAQPPGVIEQADPRIAERLRYLAARHGVRLEAA